MFDLVALEKELAATIFAGKLHFAPVTASTNFDAMAAARTAAPHGSVWFADEQTAGRGRAGHRWHSSAGEGLYVSALLRMEPAVALLPLAAGLAAADAIRGVCGLPVDLRWPNDLLIGARKTGGILVESRIESRSPLHAVVVGVGINVHQRSFPADLATPGTSLDLEAGRRVSRQALLVALLKSLEREAAACADQAAAAEIPGRFEKNSSWARGRRVEVHGPQACTGVTAGLDARGFLLVETNSGPIAVQTGGIRDAASSVGTKAESWKSRS